MDCHRLPINYRTEVDLVLGKSAVLEELNFNSCGSISDNQLHVCALSVFGLSVSMAGRLNFCDGDIRP